ncbi:gap junction protein delta 6 [Gadus chalcogrammus]|uniref:gap junction protein delta 6 n=1 Tax=Gadus chalcogrammus TaxID=1042646 RepID=UPI0024C48691|nr:gap junction protein delta 6 [Gadus chalcogrammus]
MTEWTLLKRLLDAVHQHSTMIGRLWLTVMVIFRLLVVAVATEDVYADEQEMFVCNTLQPGCATVCYDAFAPISQPRFWVFHIISVSTPSLCFIIYTWHNLSKLPHRTGHRPRARPRPGPDHVPREAGGREGARDGGQEAYDRSCDSDSCSIRSHKHLGHSVADVLEGLVAQGLQKLDPGEAGPPARPQPQDYREADAEPPRVPEGVLSKCYVFHVCVRAVLEVGFVTAQWMLFGFRVPVHFLCPSAPCTQPVDCYVSRPTEKTIFLLFMFCVGVFCILLNLLELNHLGWKKIRTVAKLRETGSWEARPARRSGYVALPPGCPSLASTLGFRDVTSTTSLPTLDLVVGHQPDWTCAGNCTLFGATGPGTEAEPRPPGRSEGVRKEGQPLRIKRENRGPKQHSAEVWI